MNPRGLACSARLFVAKPPHSRTSKTACKHQRQHRADSRGAPAAAAGGSGSHPPFHGPPGGSGGSGGSSGSGPGGGRWSWGKWTLLPAAAATLLGGVAHAFTSNSQVQLETLATARSHHKPVDWVQQLEEDPSTQKVMTAEMLLEETHPFMEDDHMFAAFLAKGIVDDLNGWYNQRAKRFLTVISLGREVCGFPRIVHGGLTAAIIDESFGGLMFALKQTRSLPAAFWGPAYTVALEVAYKHKISAGTTVLCTTEVESVEGRKLWMKATVSDGPEGKVYATARALFVAPKPHKALQDVAKFLFRRVTGDR